MNLEEIKISLLSKEAAIKKCCAQTIRPTSRAGYRLQTPAHLQRAVVWYRRFGRGDYADLKEYNTLNNSAYKSWSQIYVTYTYADQVISNASAEREIEYDEQMGKTPLYDKS